MRLIKYIAVFVLGFLLAKLFYEHKTQEKYQQEEINVMLKSINNLSKLVVTEGNFSEIYSFSDTKKYFYNYFQFKKKAIVSVNAKVEIGYDLSKLDIQLDSVQKKIIINKIPNPDIVISPDVKYFDLEQSQFNNFSTTDLNEINQKAIAKIEETIEVTTLKKQAEQRLFEELSKIYQLSKIYGWEVVNNTQSLTLNDFFKH